MPFVFCSFKEEVMAKKAPTKKQAARHGSVRNNKIIDCVDQGQVVADHKLAQQHLMEIDRLLADPDRAHRLRSKIKHKMSEGEFLKIIKKMRVDLEKKLDKNRKSKIAFPRIFKNGKGVDIEPFDLLENGIARINPVNANALLSRAQDKQAGCPWLTLGLSRSSGFREYLWARSGWSASSAYWPLSWDPNEPPPTGPNQDWEGEFGAHFAMSVDTGSTCFNDYASLGSAGIFEFRIPAPECDSIVYWGTRLIMNAPTPWFIDAGWAFVATNAYIHEQPTGGIWPVSITSFEEVSEGGWFFTSETAEAANAPKYSNIQFSRGLNVQAGVEAKIYLGVSFLLMASEGEISTIRTGGFGDYFEIQKGITYIMLPA
jgi:hypothetical protein